MRTVLRADGVTRHIALDGVMCAAALALSYLEFLLPLELIIPIPGIKIGLANIAVMIVYFALSPYDAAAVSFLRIAMSALLFGSPVSFLYSLGGGIAAYIGILSLSGLFGRGKCSFVAVSALCAVFHSIGQLPAAILMFGSFAPLTYLPVLMITGCITGILSGLLTNLLYPSVNKLFRKNK